MTGSRLQYPIVTVSKCAECQYCKKNEILDRLLCYKGTPPGLENGWAVGDGTTISAWCPLPKVEDVIKALGEAK